ALRFRARRDDLGDAGRARGHRLHHLRALDAPGGARMTGSLWKPSLLTLAALALGAIYLFPLYWMYVTSFKSATEIFANPPTFWPAEFTAEAYPNVWTTRNVGSFMWNSVVIATGVTALTILLGTGVAYVLARSRN